MKAVNVKNGKGGAEALYIEDGIPDPVAEQARVIVRIHALGLNRMDIMQREDRYPYPLLPESGKIMGVEFSGVVEATGPDCKGNFRPGDKVFGLAYGGAYAQKISVSETTLIHMPPSLSFEEAAGIPETFFTAVQAVHLVGGLQQRQTVLIRAGASGVGQSAIQVAKLGGASKIITTAGTDEKCTLCRSLGADCAVNYRRNDFADVVATETSGQGVNLIVDLVGRDYWHRNVASAAMDARIVLVAALSGSQVDALDLRALLNKRIWVMATTLRTRDLQYQGQVRDTFVEKVMEPLANGRIRTVIDKVYPWTHISEAHKRMEAGLNVGKIICLPEQSEITINTSSRPL